MPIKRKVHKLELTDEIGTKKVTAIVTAGAAKIILKDETGGYSFTPAEIDAYIDFLQTTRGACKDPAVFNNDVNKLLDNA